MYNIKKENLIYRLNKFETQNHYACTCVRFRPQNEYEEIPCSDFDKNWKLNLQLPAPIVNDVIIASCEFFYS